MDNTKDHNLSKKKKKMQKNIYIYMQHFTHIKSKTSKLKLCFFQECMSGKWLGNETLN